MLRTLRDLTASEHRLLMGTVPLVLAVRLALWALPSRVIVRRVQRASARVAEAGRRGHSADSIAWAVDAAARRIPRASCLTQAVAAQYLLLRNGHESELRVGVARGAEGFRAHAWIEHGGRILVGGAKSAVFTPLPGFSDTRARAAATE